MSTNLCADLLLVSVAAPEQIVSLSRDSRDPAISPIAGLAAAYPSNEGGVEDLLYRQPDIALVYLGWSGGRFRGLLQGQNIEILPVPYPTDWDDALATARKVAAKIGRAEEGAAVADAAARRMRELGRDLPALRSLYLRPGGGSAGTDTYVDDVLHRLGLRNVAAEAGRAGWGVFPLEEIVLHPPDVFLLGYFDQQQPLSASAYARHPLLQRLLARTPRVRLPSRIWGCGGLELVGAAAAIATQVRALDIGPAP
ncbi:MAG: ABC transporter substrate-binding protein [Thiohalocapsa sp.]|uniref:ABC transporter substrate-binding protein n=1 Tax=Thiohalocapsa sp. TaxID=2497641 RepID=UPI0025EDE35C|nr:ABC transporter substrate-binding protein [Thiohalocapsa sp.]MCG6941240.1 ABC transporter substrate-binding protein [Thiohalocapsa sp.]